MNWLDANILPWLIPVPPLVAFVLIILVLGRYKLLSQIAAITGIVLSWLMSWSVVLQAIQYKDLGLNRVFSSAVEWLPNGAAASGVDKTGALSMGVMVDPLTTVMLFMVPLACMMIFIYALGYMANDKRHARFLAYLSLFAGAMLILVVADNLLMLFIGWEVMGLCSYLLIGFWYEKTSAYRAAIKAFITTRIADVFMLLGIAYLWQFTGTLNFRDIMHSEEVLHSLATTAALGTQQGVGFLGLTAAGLIGILLFIGTIGKSAQFPLHVWLPDAMEGPTPVSAMIHAAAMVSAGIYMALRMYPVISAGSNFEEGILTPPVILMGVIGAFTALFAATIAITQNDIKKVLAYSTISQLGFMVAAMGIGAWVAAAFHLITHAFFKALLFMGSGSVIHAMEHGHHHVEHMKHDAHGHGHEEAHDAHDEAHAEHGADEHAEHALPAEEEHAFDPQDMRNMGGLFRKIPVTAITFIIGGAALMGFPIVTAGFWSKDEIFLDAWDKLSKTPLALFVLICLALAATLTAMYTFRQIVMTFFGAPRTEAAQYATITDGTSRGNIISAQMQGPLIVLAFFAIVAGWVGVNKAFPIVGPLFNAPFSHPAPFVNFVERTLLEIEPHPVFTHLAWLTSLIVFTLGVLGGYLLYWRRPVVSGQPDAFESVVGSPVYRILQNKYFIDEFYQANFVRPFQWFADKVVGPIIDQGVIDGILHFIARAATYIGELFRQFNRVVIDGVGDGIPEAIGDAARSLRSLQSGHIQQYLLYALVAALVVGGNLALIQLYPSLVLPAAIVQALIAAAIVFIGTGGPRSSEQ